MNTFGVLNQLGFSRVCEQVYDLLLDRGPVSVAELARLTGKHRPAIYGALPALVSEGLVSPYRKGKRLLYKAESPAILLSLLKKRSEHVESLLPEYIRVFDSRNKGLKVSYHEGEKGIKGVFEHVVNNTPKNGVIHRIESPREYQKNKKYYPAAYWTRAGSSGDIDKYVITNSATNSRRRKNLNRASKAIPEVPGTPFDFNITQIVSGNEVVIIDYDTETAFVIENDRFAAFQKYLYKILFKKLA